MLGALSCSSDSSSVPVCTVTTSGTSYHRGVSDGASALDLHVSPTSAQMRLVVDGQLALDVTEKSTAQGWSETATQGPAYSGQRQHVINLLRSNDVVTGDVDGKPLAPFSKDADASTVHFADGTPFTGGVAPASQHVIDTYLHLSEAASSGRCLDAVGGLSAQSVPAVTQSPGSGGGCIGCAFGCEASAVGLVLTLTKSICAPLDGIAFGIPFAICVVAVVAAGLADDVVCTNGCEQVGHPCCPFSCNPNNDNSACCDYDYKCSNQDQHLCCPASSISCNENCCDELSETCTSIADSTCCPNADVCGDGSGGATCCNSSGTQCVGPNGPLTGSEGTCCPSTSAVACGGKCCATGQTQCVGGACCSPDKVCNTLTGPVCCHDGSVCDPTAGTCVCPSGTTQCGSECCGFDTNCAKADQFCCPGNHPICGGHCCPTGIFPPCTTDSSGNEICNTCPAGNTVCSNVCCTNNSPCTPGPSGPACCPDNEACGPTACCPKGCANPATGMCNP